MLKEFIEYLESQVDKGLYVLGGQTQVIREGNVYANDTLLNPLGTLKKWMADKGQSSNYATVNRLYKKRVAKWGDITFRIMDCSGLGMNFIQNMKHIYDKDLTAQGMRSKCEVLKKSQLKRGDWVFKVNSSGKATHIGYIVDDQLNVVEDKGKSYGVVKQPFSSTVWNAYGRPLWFKEEIEKEDVIPFIFTRILKRTKPTMTGEDVKALQILLNEVNDANLATDGKFGPATEKAVKAYQKLKGLTVDGKAGKNTIRALGGIWLEKVPVKKVPLK